MVGGMNTLEQRLQALVVLDARPIFHARRDIDPEWFYRCHSVGDVLRRQAARQKYAARRGNRGGARPVDGAARAAAQLGIVDVEQQGVLSGPAVDSNIVSTERNRFHDGSADRGGVRHILVAMQLDGAGIDGLVLFNRFYQPDVDIESLEARPTLRLSSLRTRCWYLLSRARYCQQIEPAEDLLGGSDLRLLRSPGPWPYHPTT